MGNRFFKNKHKNENEENGAEDQTIREEAEEEYIVEKGEVKKIEEDVKKWNYKLTLIKKKYAPDIFCIASFPCGNILISQKDSVIKIYDENFNQIQIIENASEKWIYRVAAIDNNNFATVSYNGQLRTFTKKKDTELFKLNQIIPVFEEWMDNLIVTKRKDIITNSWRGDEIKIYSLGFNNKYKLSASLKINGNRILCADDYKLLIISNTYETYFYNLYTYKLLKKLGGVGTNDKYSLFRSDTDRIVACNYGRIKVICLNKKGVIATIEGFAPNIGCNVDGKGIFLCARETFIWVFRSDLLVCIQIIEPYRDTIYGIFCHKSGIIMCYSLRVSDFQIYKIEEEKENEQ